MSFGESGGRGRPRTLDETARLPPRAHQAVPATLGIGAAWNEDEARGLGLFFPRTAERFERLEEALQIMKQMWSDSDAPYEGTHYKLARTLNSPRYSRGSRGCCCPTAGA